MTQDASTAKPVTFYGVVVEGGGWINRLFLADELEPSGGKLHNRCQVLMLAGPAEGQTGEVRREIASSEWRTLDYYRGQGWEVPLGLLVADPAMERFRVCDQAVNRFFQSWLEAGRAALEIERDALWRVAGYPSNRAYWVAKGEDAAKEGNRTVTYERVLQLIGAARTIESLQNEGIDPTPFGSEKSLRALNAAPEDVRPQVAQALTVESQITGRPITENLTKKVVADVEAGLTVELLQERFAPYGVFRHFTPTSRKNQRFRFSFEDGGGARLFQSLSEANNWLNEHQLQPRIDMGCPTCANCMALTGGAAVCGKTGESVLHTRIWNAPGWCGGWTEKANSNSAPTPAPVEVPLASSAPTPQQNIHERLVAASSRRKEPSPHDENNTPADLWEPALFAWGMEAFDLDPMTNSQSTVPAVVGWTVDEDCFAQETWAVAERVVMWGNPAFSMNDEFSERFIQELEAGHITEAFILDKADSRTQWSQRLLGQCSATCRVLGYTTFENSERENGSATFPLEILYFGSNVERFAQAYAHLGLITVPYRF
jgi:hypothetical protein